MIYSFLDDELGKVIVKRNATAKRCIARYKDGSVELTIPRLYTDDLILHVFSKLKPEILNLSKPKLFRFTPETTFGTFSFKVSITVQEVKNYYVTINQGILGIVCPIHTDFAQTSTQKTIRSYIEKAMKMEAKRLLPSKVEYWARFYNFTYDKVKVNSSKTRWGSCSSKGNINLSYSCMLLPEYLIDFIVLHELCHTKEMNHGIHFWKLLNSVTDDRAKEFTKNLQEFTTNW